MNDGERQPPPRVKLDIETWTRLPPLERELVRLFFRKRYNAEPNLERMQWEAVA